MAGQTSSKAGGKPGPASAPSAPAVKPAGPPTIKPLAAAPGIAPAAAPSKPPLTGPPKISPAKAGQPPVIGKASAPVAGANQTPAPMQALRPVPPKDAASASLDGVGAVDVVPMSLTGTAWPCNVPSVQHALQLLSVDGARSANGRAGENVLSSLSEIEMGALIGRKSSLDLAGLRQAILVRWRLANALETKPPIGSPIDAGALERLLNEADAALSKLQVPEAATESVRAGYASARGALAKHAVALSEIAAELAQRTAVDAAAHKATKKYQHVARIVAKSADTAKVALRSKVLWAGLALAFLGAAGFHGYRYMQERNVPENRGNAPAASMHGYKDPSSGITMLHSVDPTKPVDPAELAKLKADVESKGQKLHQVGVGHYLIAPTNVPIMGDSSPQPPAQP